MKNKLQNLLVKILILLVSALMVLLLYNEYAKSLYDAYNTLVREVELLLCLAIAVVTFFITYLDRKKNAVYLIIFYLITALLYAIYKHAGRI